MKELLESLKDSAIKHGEMQRIDDINRLEKYIDDLSLIHISEPTRPY